MPRTLKLATLCTALFSLCLLGCGSGGNDLATDSGDMTVEEYNALQEKAAADMNAMPADAMQTKKP